jgi:integrase
MNAFRRGRGYYVYVPTPQGGLVRRACGTTDAATARKIYRLVRELAETHRWAPLQAVLAGRLSLKQLYAAHVTEGLDALGRRMASTPLLPYVDPWMTALRAQGRAPATLSVYRQHVTDMIAAGIDSTVSLTAARVTAWIGGLDVGQGTRRNYLMSLRGFVAYLRMIDVLTSDPLEMVKTPKRGAPRTRHETIAADLAIVEAVPAEWQAFMAFVKATGAEVSPALNARAGDIDLSRLRCRVRGTKTARRDRAEAEIEPWALPFLKRWMADKLPGATLWPGRSRYQAHWHHQQACKALGVADYTLRDARHSWAVRARRDRGYTWEQIAKQLGSSSYIVSTVYAVFDITVPSDVPSGGAHRSPAADAAKG